MKLLKLVLIAFLIASCSSTKKIATTSESNSQEEIQKSKDSTEETKEVSEPKEEEIKTTDGYITDDGVSVTVETVMTKPIEAFHHDAWNALLQKHVSKEGNVNYKGFQKDRIALRNYIKTLSEQLPQDDWTKNDKLAYWINAYNALTVDLILRNLPLQSIKDIDKPWDQRLWKFGEKWYNLNQIEHQILRKMNEPRIHFAIVCASISCPKLQNTAFTALDLESQLTNATQEFLSDTSKNKITENTIKLSKIFKWFAKDFKENGSLIDFLNQYSDTKISSKAKKSFMDYDWNLNE